MWTNFMFASCTAVAVFSGLMHALPLDDDKELYYPLVIFEEFVPEWKNFLSWIYRLGFLVVPFIIPLPLYLSIYYITKCLYQVMLFMTFIENINMGFDTSSIRLIENSEFQKTINKRLLFCIKRHSHFYA